MSSFTPQRVESKFSANKGVTVSASHRPRGGQRVVRVKWENGTEATVQTADLCFYGPVR